MSINEDLSYLQHRVEQERQAAASAPNSAAANIHAAMADTYAQQAIRLSARLRVMDVGAPTI